MLLLILLVAPAPRLPVILRAQDICERPRKEVIRDYHGREVIWTGICRGYEEDEDKKVYYYLVVSNYKAQEVTCFVYFSKNMRSLRKRLLEAKHNKGEIIITVQGKAEIKEEGVIIIRNSVMKGGN